MNENRDTGPEEVVMRPSSRWNSLVVVALLLLAGSTGCASWKKQPASPEALLGQQKAPHLMRVTLANGSRVEIENPAIRGDSLVGKVRSWARTDWGQSQKTADGGVLLADIRKVEVRKFSAGKTLLLAAVAAGATAIIVAGDSKDPPVSSPAPSSGGSGGGSGDGCAFCSCPLLYSYTGTEWVLDSGTYGGAFLKPFAYTDLDVLESLKSVDGALRMRLRAGDKETDHIDAVEIVAADHDPGTMVATDPAGTVRAVGATTPPVYARDSRGRDALPFVREADDRSWESALAVRDTASACDLREDLTLEFPRWSNVNAARLVVRAHKTGWAGHLMRAFVAAHGTATASWYAAMDADPTQALAFRQAIAQEVHLNVEVWEGDRWVRQSSVWGGGPEVPKTHAIPLDLSRVTGDRIRVRLVSSPSFWLVDWVALDTTLERPVVLHEVAMRSAIAADGRDVAPNLRAKDGRDLLLETGEVVELALDDPPPAPGLQRTYLSRATGWYRYHAPETGPPDTELLTYLLREPHGITKMSIAWMNAALTSLALAPAGATAAP